MEKNTTIKTASLYFDAKTGNKFNISKYDWKADKEEIDVKELGLFGAMVKEATLSCFSGKTDDGFEYFTFEMSWKFETGRTNGREVGTIYIKKDEIIVTN